jgi:hypothetical protein
MRLTRVAAAATSLLLLGASSTIGSANAATTGIGTSKASTTVLDVSLGNLLGVKVLGDSAQSTIDSKTAAAPEAFSKLTAAAVTSSVTALNTTIDAKESRQPGGSPEVTISSVDLANPGGVVPAGLPNVLGGTLNAGKLTSAVDAAGARSTLTESLTNLSVAGGLLNATGISSASGTDAASAASSSTRSAKVDAVTVLDLGALLDGLGIPLSSLSVDQVSALLDTLQTTVAGLDPNTTLADTYDAVLAEVDTLTTLAGTTGIPVGETVGGIVDAIGLGGVIDDTDLSGVTGTAQEQATLLIPIIKGALASVLGDALAALDAAPLLKLDGIDISVTTKAADTAANSVAAVTGKIGSVTVGSISLPAIDLVQTADQINAAVATVVSTVSGVLDTVQATVGADLVSLKDLVSVEVLKQTKSITTANGYTVANAGITGLTAKITPPALLSGLAGAIEAATGVNEAIAALGGTAPELDSAIADLEAVLGGVDAVLADGATVQAVQVLGSSEYKVNAAVTTPGGNLPRTGGDALRLAALGFLLVALGLGLGRWMGMPMPAWARRD